jgi:acyl dehydratase
MVAHARPVGPGRYRESHGRYFEEFEVGAVYEHRPGRTITEADNIQFSLLTMNLHPLHCDAAYGAKTEFGRCLVNSALTIAIVLGMSVADVSAKAVANLGIDKRESKSRPTQGLVTVRTTGRKADGTVIMTFERTALVPKCGHAVEDRIDS